MAKKKPPKLDVGANGEVRLPPDALEALGLQPGEQVTLFVDTRRKQIRLERFVDDPWGEALKEKPQKGFGDLFSDQEARDAEAKRQFDEGIKKPLPKRKPEDDPDYWR